MNWNYENEQWRTLPNHLRHLPLFTRHFDFSSWIIRSIWGLTLKQLVFKFFIRINVIGSFEQTYKEHKKILIISNHCSHLDTVCIASALPFKFWLNFYICAAKDYWFSSPVFSFFSQYCLGAIPIDRTGRGREAMQLCLDLLNKLDRIWMLIYPEGSRSKDGYIKKFKRGISVFSQETNTPILFLYLKGTKEIMPKGGFIRPGKVTLHIGPVQQPDSIEKINKNYKDWVYSIDSHALLERPIVDENKTSAP